MPFSARSVGVPSAPSGSPAGHRRFASSTDETQTGLPSASSSLPSTAFSVSRPSPSTASLFDEAQQIQEPPSLPPSKSASSVRSATSRSGESSLPAAAAQSPVTRRPSAGGLLSPLADVGLVQSHNVSPSRSVYSQGHAAQSPSGGNGLAAVLGNALKPKAKWSRGLTRRGSSSAMSILGSDGSGSTPAMFADASASTPSLRLNAVGRVEGDDARHPTVGSPLRPTTTHGSSSPPRSAPLDRARSSAMPSITTSTPFGRPPPRSAPPGSSNHPSSSPSTLVARGSTSPASREPLERKPSRLFFSLRKGDAKRRPSAVSLFGGSQAGPSAAAVEREIDVGAPFNCQHDLHVGMDDLTALPVEWIAQLKAQGLSTEQLLKLARDKSRSVAEREKVTPQPIAQAAAEEAGVPTAVKNLPLATQQAPSPSELPRLEMSGLSTASESTLAAPEVKANAAALKIDRTSYISERAPSLALPASLLPSSSTGSEPADSWAEGLLGAFSTPFDGSLGKAGARRSLPPTRRVSSSAPPLGSDGVGGGAHGHSQSLSFLSACKPFDAEGNTSLAPLPQWMPLSAETNIPDGLGASQLKFLPNSQDRSTSRASSTRPRESSSDHGHGAVDGTGNESGAADEGDRPPRRRQRQVCDSVESFATAASDSDRLSPRDSHAMDGLEEFGVPSASARAPDVPLLAGTFGQASRSQWLDQRTDDGDDVEDESGPLPDLLSSVSSTGNHRASTTAGSRLSVASRFTATSRVTSLSPSTFSSSDFHSHEGQLVEDAVISRAVHLSSRPVGDWAHHDGKAMRLTMFAPAFSWPVEKPSVDAQSPSSPAAEANTQLSTNSHNSTSLVNAANDNDDIDARDGADALDQAVQMFRARSLDNLRALTRSESARSSALVEPA